MIRTKKANYYKKRLISHRNDSKSLWLTINEIMGKHCNKTPNGIELDNERITDEQQIAEAFNCYFAAIGNDTSPQHQYFQPPGESFKETKLDHSFLF